MPSTIRTGTAVPRPAPGPASRATPPSPTASPAHRIGVSRSPERVSQASSALKIGTAATSRPLVELGRCFSAVDSSANGPTISNTVNAASHPAYPLSARRCPPRIAAGRSSSEPSATLVKTSTGTETPPSATLISR